MKLRLKITILLIVLGLLRAATLSAALTVLNGNIPAGFDQLGIIQEATLNNPADPNSGGTLTINGIKMIVPANSVIQFPASTAKWADIFNPAFFTPVYDPAIPVQPALSITPGTSGLSLMDNPAQTLGISPWLPFNATVLGNIDVEGVTGNGKGAYIIGLILPIAQDIGNVGAGFITAIDYAKGRLEVNGTLGVLGTGTIIEINDPTGRYGWAHSPDPRWSVDADNPTIVAGNGFPMGLPRVAPAGGALFPASGEVGDPDRPYYNRPLNGNPSFPIDPFVELGAPIMAFFMPAKAAPNAPGDITPDPWKQAPLMIGDYISWEGVMYKLNPAAPLDPLTPIARQTYISANTIDIDKFAVYTQPGTQPSYMHLERMVVGAGGGDVTVPPNTAPGAPGGIIPQPEPKLNVLIRGFSTDSTSLVDVFAVDWDSVNGGETHRLLGTVLPEPGFAAGKGNKGRFTFAVGKGNFQPTTRMYGAQSHTGTAIVPNQTGNVIPPQGLLSGQYRAPMFTFQYADAAPGFPAVPNSFNDQLFLFLGEGGNPNGSAGPLNPFPPFIPVALPPVILPLLANADTAVTLIGTPVTINVTANDLDPNAGGIIDPLSVTVVLSPANGTVGPATAAGVTYTPAAGFAGVDTFTYNVRDNFGAVSNNATVTVTVRGFSISGTITNRVAIPLPGVTVNLTGAATRTTTTDALGKYTFTGLSNGSYTVTPVRTGLTFTPANHAVTIAGANVINQNFTTTTFLISGKVATRLGAAVPGVTMTLIGNGLTLTTTTNATGNFTFSLLPNGTYTVTPSQPGRTFTPASRSITVNNGNRIGQNFVRN